METAAQLWTQNYTPIGGNLWLSALAALVPIIFFFIALLGLKMKGYKAGAYTLLIAFLIAVFVYHMPVFSAVMSALYGFGYALWPIGWIVLMAVFLYKITVKTGQFDIIRESVLSITRDERLLVVLIAYCFSSFLEGAAGFGAPVAICAALLVGLGLNPIFAAGLCLIANMAGAAFGALGVPVIVAGQVSGLPFTTIGQAAVFQLPVLSFVLPFFLAFVVDGFKGIRETFPALLVAGLSYAVTQFLVVTYLGPQLPNILAALVSMVATALFLRVWQPSHIKLVPAAAAESTAAMENTIDEGGAAPAAVAAPAPAAASLTAASVAKAWAPFLLLTLLVIIWTLPGFKSLFAAGGPLEATMLHWDLAGVNNYVVQDVPIVKEPTPYHVSYKLDLIPATGTAILMAALLSMAMLGMPAKQGWETFKETFNEMKFSILNIMMVLGFAFVANYSGQSATLALVLAQTGGLFPLFSPILGWLGVFLTGSAASSNALFSNLQYATAQQLNLNPVLMLASNTNGGAPGKMISPQSIAVAAAAVSLVGREGELLSFTIRKSLGFLVIMMILIYAEAYWFPGIIPAPPVPTS